MKIKKLYTALEIAEALGITKSSVHAAMREGRILKPAYQTGNVYGWTESQKNTIEKEWAEKCK